MKVRKGVFMRVLVLFLLVASFSFSSLDEGIDLYQKRGESIESAFLAQEKFESALLAESDLLERFEVYRLLLETTFYYAANISSEDVKIKHFKKLKEYSKNALRESKVKIIEKPVVPGKDYIVDISKVEETKYAAEFLYFYAMALSNLMNEEVSSKIDQLTRWREIKACMGAIQRKLKQRSIQFYGADRTLGIGEYNKPKFIKKMSRAVKYLFYSYQRSINEEYSTSAYAFNTLMYSEVLRETKKTKESCSVLKKLVELNQEDLLNLNKSYFPENMINYKIAQKRYEKECE